MGDRNETKNSQEQTQSSQEQQTMSRPSMELGSDLIEFEFEGVTIWYWIDSDNEIRIAYSVNGTLEAYRAITELKPNEFKDRASKACRAHFETMLAHIRGESKESPCTRDKYTLAPYVSPGILWIWSREDPKFSVPYEKTEPSEWNDETESEQYPSTESDEPSEDELEQEDDPSVGAIKKSLRFVYT